MDRLRRGETRAEVAPAHAHLVGIAGRGMSGLAQLLVQRGMLVTGSEPSSRPAVERLKRLGARIHAGHSPRGAQFLVYHPEVGRDHPSRLAATRRGIDQASVGQWLGLMMRQSISLAAVGRRTASMASAMIGWTLTRAGLDPTIVLGAEVPQLGGWGRVGSGPHFVAEGIEGPGEIGPAAPRLALLLDLVEECPWLVEDRKAAIRQFACSVPADGYVLALEDNPMVAEAVRDLAPVVERISLDRPSDWWGADLREDRGCFRFRAFHKGRFAVEVQLRVPGRRNVLGALAAVAACDRLSVPIQEIKQGLEEFTGLSRDFESRGSYRGVTLVDDAGCDPESVAETLSIARQVFGPRPIWAVICTGEDARSAAAEAGYPTALATADHVLVTEGSQVGGGRRANSLVEALIASGVNAREATGLDDVIRELDRNLEPGDVLVTLGAGDVGTIADAFIRRLSRDHQGR
ncbi:UDP-N-acetylmuramate--L-alanine ligase [Singulisphaera sp. GP187]|uniref:Mur ligase domain-containing protein n=1 Tax=Singulisphaera sp. GP187 TaxID=1882752 RepID=UPI000925D259|nr:Mur ligase domain-containing protein [Singulisphaera sp. GP187]SIO02581.1 UDP-N-acetylmuramate--L-alanine ligase [Singulisphaera sp. GP187]